MSRGIRGTFVIDWSQVEVDGMSDLEPEDLAQGARWVWRGKPVRLDGPQELLSLGQSIGQENMQRRAARVVDKLWDDPAFGPRKSRAPRADMVMDHGIRLTDGQGEYVMYILRSPLGTLAVFEDQLPEPGCDFWVVDPRPRAAVAAQQPVKGLVCVGGDAFLETGGVPQVLAEISPGDMVSTLDRGPVPVLWTGEVEVSGARLHVMPHMRPVRIKAGALGDGVPHRDLLVSARQRVLVKGRIARDLYNCEEVLIAAKDMVNGRDIYLDHRVRGIHYKMILLQHHELLCANGVLVESFHPGRADLDYLSRHDRAKLQAILPMVGGSPDGYGADVRRGLSTSEAAILKYAQGAS